MRSYHMLLHNIIVTSKVFYKKGNLHVLENGKNRSRTFNTEVPAY